MNDFDFTERDGKMPVSDAVRLAKHFFGDLDDATRAVLFAIQSGQIPLIADAGVFHDIGGGDPWQTAKPSAQLFSFDLPLVVYSADNWGDVRTLLHNSAKISVVNDNRNWQYVLSSLWADAEAVLTWGRGLQRLFPLVETASANAPSPRKEDCRKGKAPNVQTWQHIVAAVALCVHREGIPGVGETRAPMVDRVMEILSVEMGDDAPSAREPIRKAVTMAIDLIGRCNDDTK